MTQRFSRGFRFGLGMAAALALSACGGGDGADGDTPEGGTAPIGGTPSGGDPNVPLGGSTPVSVAPNAEAAEVRAQLDGLAGLTAEDLQAQRALPFKLELGYTPSQATHLDTIQASPFSLNAAELAQLDARGFAITERHKFPSFSYGYVSLYMADLPLFVSADSILFALHRSYDKVLEAVERAALIPALDTMLDAMQASLTAGRIDALGPEAVKDADLFLAVTRALLTNERPSLLAGGDAAQADRIFESAKGAEGADPLTIFGAERLVDYSQFAPRGHYNDELEGDGSLARYFRAMMWLGRMDLRLIETLPDGTQVFRRRQFDAALGLHALLDATGRTAWQRLDRAIGAFVGEPDNMTVDQFSALMQDLGVTAVADLADLDDDRIAQAIVAGGYGQQRILSQYIINGVGSKTLPLSAVFLLLGQRYVLDSHVFSNVVYDRVTTEPWRMMPNPLDVAYAALGNDQAVSLLDGELTTYGYAPNLESVRVLADAHGETFWNANLYNLWLSSLRALSPRAEDLADPGAAGLPVVAATEAWGRRVLNTQLASWAELRHDTLLYAKQSYTGGASCEYPDAYVEPNPAFFASVARYAAHGRALLGELDLGEAQGLGEVIRRYFDHTAEVATTLEGMAVAQRTGAPYTEAQLEFINDAVVLQDGCGAPAGVEGWYARLFFDALAGLDYDPTIADVHTQPTDAAGNEVGRVLHVGTGMPRLGVFTVETCNGPRAYAGLVSSYFEQVTEDFDRLTDERWSQALTGVTPADPVWMSDLVSR